MYFLLEELEAKTRGGGELFSQDFRKVWKYSEKLSKMNQLFSFSTQ